MKFVGVKDNKAVIKFLNTKDPCFAEEFSKSSDECKSCTAPVVLNGKIYLLKEICAAACSGAAGPVSLNRLTSSDVRARIEEGLSTREIFEEILGNNDPKIAATEARSLLANRLRYIKDKWGLPTPTLPKTDELLDE